MTRIASARRRIHTPHPAGLFNPSAAVWTGDTAFKLTMRRKRESDAIEARKQAAREAKQHKRS